MMNRLRILILCITCCVPSLAQVTNKIPYTLSNGVQIAGVDGTNPVIYDNDWVIDTIEDDFLWLKAHNGLVKLVGNIITRDMYDCNFPKNGPCNFSMQQNIDAWKASWNTVVQMGLKNIPQPILGADAPLTKPASGRIEDTQYKVSAGSALIVAEANKASVSKPLVIFTGGNLTTVANAYLQDPTIANKVVVFQTAGYGPSRLYNTTDFWSVYTVMKKMKYINWTGDSRSWYPGKNVNVTQSMINSLPNNPMTSGIKGYWWQVVFAKESIGDAPPVLYFFNHSLWKNVARLQENHQVVTGDIYDYLLVSENDWTNYGPTLMNFFRDASYASSPPPNTSPVVNLTSPANNAAFTAGSNITLSASASDANGSVSKVEFFYGSTKLGEDATSPYSIAWNNVPAGTYSLTAKATDNQNAVTISSTVTITVNPGNVSPTVTLIAPTNNAVFPAGSNITLTAVAADTDGAVTKVEFYQGSTKLGEDLTSPYSFVWTNVSTGVYSLTARAIDNQNAAKSSPAISISVANTNISPTVTITAPANNANYTAGNNISIVAQAADSDGTITRVEFYNGTTKLGEDTTNPYSFLWTNVPVGQYTLTVKAIDNQNATTTSSGVTVTVTKSNVPPAVALTGPTNNSSFPAGGNMTLAASASDADGSVSKVEFYSGNTKIGEDLTSPYTYVWNNVQVGTYTLSAKAIDNLNAVGTSTVVGVSVVKNNVPPTVAITAPANNSRILAGSNVSILVTALDQDGSVAKVEFFNGATKLGEGVSSPFSFVWTNVPAGIYTLTARATDNQQATTTSAIVTLTVAENMPPSIVITAPANRTVFSANDNFTISASATDTDGTVNRVEFFQGDIKLGEDLTRPFSYVWTNIPIGNYTLTARATDNRNATTVSAPVTLSVTASAPPSVNAGPDVTIEIPENSVTLTGSGTAAGDAPLSFQWNQISGPNTVIFSDPTHAEVTVSNLTEGLYVLELTGTDTKGSSGSDQVRIVVSGVSLSQSLIPRFFTPNDDGVNDFWEWPKSEVLEKAVLMVFNRFGQKIYEAFPYENTWDGKVGGKPLEPDAYYYVIRLLNHTDIKGAVRIIR